MEYVLAFAVGVFCGVLLVRLLTMSSVVTWDFRGHVPPHPWPHPPLPDHETQTRASLAKIAGQG